MIVTLVHVLVKTDKIEAFKQATIANHLESVKESGNLRFDLLQEEADPCKFIIYEAYESDEAAARHKETLHYEIWRNTVAEWMAEPRKGVKHHIIAPMSAADWKTTGTV